MKIIFQHLDVFTFKIFRTYTIDVKHEDDKTQDRQKENEMGL